MVITFSMEVEPSVETVPERSPLAVVLVDAVLSVVASSVAAASVVVADVSAVAEVSVVESVELPHPAATIAALRIPAMIKLAFLDFMFTLLLFGNYFVP
jgi:hypothetical protein